MPKKMRKKGDPETHSELKGFDIKVNEFGQIVGSFEVDKINTFLNGSVEDKKLKDRSGKYGEEE
jgi:hypothetical protein